MIELRDVSKVYQIGEERVRAERERRAEQREECAEGLFHGRLVV